MMLSWALFPVVLEKLGVKLCVRFKSITEKAHYFQHAMRFFLMPLLTHGKYQFQSSDWNWCFSKNTPRSGQAQMIIAKKSVAISSFFLKLILEALLFSFQPITHNFNQLHMPIILEIFSLILRSKIELFSMSIYSACQAFVTLKKDEAGNVLRCLRSVVETMKQHDQVNVLCPSLCEKLTSCIFCYQNFNRCSNISKLSTMCFCHHVKRHLRSIEAWNHKGHADASFCVRQIQSCRTCVVHRCVSAMFLKFEHD